MGPEQFAEFRHHSAHELMRLNLSIADDHDFILLL